MAFLATLMKRAKQKESKLTPEERAERNRIYEEYRKKQRISAFIQQGTCPNCSSKLIRGKKDKKNDYKRMWTCKSCDSKFER